MKFPTLEPSRVCLTAREMTTSTLHAISAALFLFVIVFLVETRDSAQLRAAYIYSFPSSRFVCFLFCLSSR